MVPRNQEVREQRLGKMAKRTSAASAYSARDYQADKIQSKGPRSLRLQVCRKWDRGCDDNEADLLYQLTKRLKVDLQ